MNFSTNISVYGQSHEHLSDFAFVNMANVTLVRHDSYFSHVKSALKQDTLTALRQAPMDLPDSVLKRDEDMASLKTKVGPMDSPVVGGTIVFTPTRGWINRHRKSGKPTWKQLGRLSKKKGGCQSIKFSSRPARGQPSYK